MINKEKILKEKFSDINIDLNDSQVQQFIQYYELLVSWNKVMNLTAITDYNDVVEKHFIDSLMISKIIDMKEISSVIDVGTGAGFPGIPLKIVFPHLKVTLLDSLNKRIKFLNEVIDQSDLENVDTIHGRAEDFAKQNEFREKYDLCVSRAVANLTTLSEYCLPYVKIGGKFIPYKSGDIDQEIVDSENAISILGGYKKDLYRFTLPGTDIKRSMIIVEKVKSTSKKYPRKAGLPSKEPIH
ncbi:MAG: 16S rRNA (guanine(527)-N(7))-methyltransferase RsmG [Lachnospiraceae bacterium]